MEGLVWSVDLCSKETDVVNVLKHTIDSLRMKTVACTKLVLGFGELRVICIYAKVRFGKDRLFRPSFFIVAFFCRAFTLE